MKHFPLILLMCATFLSFNAPDIPVPGRNDVAVGGTAVTLVDRELVLDYEIRFGGNVVSCDVDVIVLADKVPYRFTKYYSGDYGRVTSPGRKQVRFNIAPHKELLAGRDIKFRIDVVRRELGEGRPIEAVPAVTMPEVVTSSTTSTSSDSAVCSGTVLSDGGSALTAKGFVWSRDPNPTVSLKTKTNEGKGSGNFSSTLGSLQSGTKYYVRAYATNSVGTFYGQEIVFSVESGRKDIQWNEAANVDMDSVTDLSSPASANCYIVSQSGTYKFRTVKGNSSVSVGQVTSAEVLWETFGTSTAPSKGDLIRDASFADGFVTFSMSGTFRKGNAVVAAKDAAGNILWSWHIWLTDVPQGQAYRKNAGVMMDRNLGATSATPGDVGALGLLYQWGRKDPFLGSSSTSSDTEAKSTITWPSTVSSYSSTGTVAYATAHPTTFITYNSSNYDWYYSTGSSTDNTRWQSSKTIYDPCPAGWRVPDGGSSGVWSKAFGKSRYWKTSSNWDSTNKGMNFSKTDKKLGSSGPIWYPASGYRSSSGGALLNVGSYGIYWSVSPGGEFAYGLYLNNNGSVNPALYSDRAYGRAVRCLQE